MRLAAARLEATGGRWQLAARRLRAAAATLARQWRGEAADEALRQLEGLARAAVGIAAAHDQAATVLAACARAVEEAQATWQRAAALEAQDLQRRAERDRAAARGAFVSPYDLDGSGLRRHAREVAAQAHTHASQACARAAAQLHALTAQAAPDRDVLTAADQAAGVGRGAVDALRGTADLLRTLSDPRVWPGAAQGLVDGLAYAAGHPREALAATTGWDLLQDGRYGEWAGGLVPDLLTGVLSGGAVPAGRRAAESGRRLAELADDVDDRRGRDDRGAARRPPVPGGPVRPLPGAVMTPRYPKVIRTLTGERQGHILVGDPPPRTGGGHASGAGRGKSEFPQRWSHDDIVRRVMDTATRPRTTVDQADRPTMLAHAEHDGVCVRVVVDPGGGVVTAYPVRGKQAAAGCPR